MFIEEPAISLGPKLRRSGMVAMLCGTDSYRLSESISVPAVHAWGRTCRSYGAWRGVWKRWSINMALLPELLWR